MRYELHCLLADGDDELISSNELRFRTESELTGSLAEAAFSVEHLSVTGTVVPWAREPAS